MEKYKGLGTMISVALFDYSARTSEACPDSWYKIRVSDSASSLPSVMSRWLSIVFVELNKKDSGS